MSRPYWASKETEAQLRRLGERRPYVVAVWLGTERIAYETRTPDFIMGTERIPTDEELVDFCVMQKAPCASARVLSRRLESVSNAYAWKRKVVELLRDQGETLAPMSWDGAIRPQVEEPEERSLEAYLNWHTLVHALVNEMATLEGEELTKAHTRLVELVHDMPGAERS